MDRNKKKKDREKKGKGENIGREKREVSRGKKIRDNEHRPGKKLDRERRGKK